MVKVKQNKCNNASLLFTHLHYKFYIKGMERLWSYLSHYVTMSRQMSAKNRILTLCHAITHFKKMRIEDLGKFITIHIYD